MSPLNENAVEMYGALRELADAADQLADRRGAVPSHYRIAVADAVLRARAVLAKADEPVEWVRDL